MQPNVDTDKRQQSHLEGRQHLGITKIRSALEELKSHKDLYAHIDIERDFNYNEPKQNSNSNRKYDKAAVNFRKNSNSHSR